MDAWEGRGSVVISARPLRPPSPVLNLRVLEINATGVRLAFTRPEEAVSLSGYRVISMQSPDALAPVPVTPHANETIVAHADSGGLQDGTVFASVAGLESGRLYYFAVQAMNPGGGGVAARITVRPFGAVPGPDGVQVMFKNTKAAFITWRPPLNLGLSGVRVIGYHVECVIPPGSFWGESGSTTLLVGTTAVTTSSAGTEMSHALANSTILGMQSSRLTYGVRALVEQDLAFGGGIVRGSVSVASISVGRIPSWRGKTPPDGSNIIAWIGQTVAVSLEVRDDDIVNGQSINFQLFGGAPPESQQGILSAGILREGSVEYHLVNRSARSQLIFTGTREVLPPACFQDTRDILVCIRPCTCAS